MASVNKVILIGNLGRDPETRYSSDNSLQITSMTVATTSYRRSQNGERGEEVEWHRVVLFGRQAEVAQQYLRKGSPVYVEGRLRTRRWDKDGQTHYTTEIIAENIQLLGSRGASDAAGAPQGGDDFESPRPAARTSYSSSASRSAPAAPQSAGSALDDMSDDVPF